MRGFSNINADQVFDYGVSEVIRKIASGGHISFLLRVFRGLGLFG